MASPYGVPEGSALTDWPITYDDLEPFYSEAEWRFLRQRGERRRSVGRAAQPGLPDAADRRQPAR